MSKYGFVYIWRDRKHNRYYIGSHWGDIADGYVCSSTWMRNAFKRRPRDFKRRIIKTGIDRRDLITEEQQWLDMIKDHEVGSRYYNLNKNAIKHWHVDPSSRKTVGQKISAAPHRRENISKAMKGKKPSALNVRRRMETMTGRKQTKDEIEKRVATRAWYSHSEETKQKMRKPKEEVTCPHCQKQGGISAMKRWHFNNCAHK